MAKEKAALPQVVAAQFDIVGDWSRCHFFGHFGEVDFNALTLERAESLINGGFPYLKVKIVEVTPQNPPVKKVEKAVEKPILETVE